jgi:multidrug efflux pump
MMVVKMEQGWDRFKAATFAYTSTAFPMLTGTLITAAGLHAGGFRQIRRGRIHDLDFPGGDHRPAGSWIVAVVFTPWLGYKLLDPAKLRAIGEKHGGDIYDSPFYRRFRALVVWCLRHRWLVIGATIGVFGLSLVAFNKGVQKQFFPAASRPEIMIDIWLPQGASLKATAREVKRVEALLEKDDNIASWSSYIGNGAPRFFLSLDQQLFADNFGQMVIVTKGLKEREIVKHRLEQAFESADGAWSHLRLRVVRLENGPPVGYPVQFRVLGEDLAALRDNAEGIAAVMRGTSQPAQRQFRLERQGQVGARRNRPGAGPGAGRFQPGRGADAAGLAGGRHGDPVSRERPVDRRGLARRADSGRGEAAADPRSLTACPTSTSCPPAGATFRWPRWRAWCRCWRKA